MIFNSWKELLDNIAITVVSNGVVVSVSCIDAKVWQVNQIGPLAHRESESELVVSDVKKGSMISPIWDKQGHVRRTTFSQLFEKNGKIKEGLLI